MQTFKIYFGLFMTLKTLNHIFSLYGKGSCDGDAF